MPMTTEGTPFSTSSVSRTNWLTRVLANSLVNSATSTPIGTAIAVAIADDDQRADDRIRDTCALTLSDGELRRRLREEVEAERLEAVHDDREDDQRQNCHRKQSGEAAEPDHQDVDEAPAARSAVVSLEASREVGRCGADAHWRFRSTLRMITRAIRLKMSERTRRISAR